jgi:hypothetical protein
MISKDRVSGVINLNQFSSHQHRELASTLLESNAVIKTEDDIRAAIGLINKIPEDRIEGMTAFELVNEFGLGKVVWWIDPEEKP